MEDVARARLARVFPFQNRGQDARATKPSRHCFSRDAMDHKLQRRIISLPELS